MELKYTYVTSIPYYRHTISRIKANLIYIEVQCMYTKFIYNKTNHKFFVNFFPSFFHLHLYPFLDFVL